MWLLLTFILSVSGLTLFNPDLTLWHHDAVFCEVPACVPNQEWYVPRTLVLANSINLPRRGVLFQTSPVIDHSMTNFTASITYRGSPNNNLFTVEIVVNGTRRGYSVLSPLGKDNQTVMVKLHENLPVGTANVSFILSTPQSNGIPADLNIIGINLHYEQKTTTSTRALIGFIIGGFLLLTWLLCTIYVTVKHRC